MSHVRDLVAASLILVLSAGIGLVAGYIFSAPYEDVKLKGK